MYVQKIKSKRNGKVYLTYLIKESYRTEKGPRSRTICNITSLPSEIRDAIVAQLKGKKVVEENLIGLCDAKDFGGIAVLHHFWDHFGMDNALEHIADQRSRKLIKAMVFARILFPGSKLSLSTEAMQTVLAEACGLDSNEVFDEDHLYGAMDALNGNWSDLEKALYKNHIKPVDVVLYDLTSVYFEGNGPKNDAKFGHSRDHRSDRKQVLLAVATTSSGLPVHLEVLRGNRNDNSTLLGLLKTLRRRFGITEATFCFDGGMSSRFNLEKMDAQDLRFVTRQSNETLKSLITQLPSQQQPNLWDRTKLMEFTIDNRRYVIAGSEERKHRDQQRRQSRIHKAKMELKRLSEIKRKNVDAQKLASQIGRALQRLKAHKYFDYKINEKAKIEWALKNEIVEREQATDGYYLLVTNITDTAYSKEEVCQSYKNLLVVENAFRSLKTYLEVRPIYHYRQDRVRNHVRICFLAHWLQSQIAQKWRQLKINDEVPLVLRKLQKIRIGTLVLGENTTTRRMTQIPCQLQELIGKLEIHTVFNKLPPWACS